MSESTRAASHTARIALLTAAMACATVSNAEQHPLSACRGIADDATRLACYDSMADQANVLADQATATADQTSMPANAEPAAAAPAPSAPSAEDFFGRDARQSEDIALRSAGTQPAEDIYARVAGTRVNANGKLTLELDNGQVWTQVDSSRLRIKDGEEVRIRRAVFNSFLLSRVQGGTAIRVRRYK